MRGAWCAVLRQGRVFVEYTPQTRVEGDIQQLPADFAVTDLWEVLAGHRPGRTRNEEVTVFDSVGFALEDFSALRFMRDTAMALGKDGQGRDRFSTREMLSVEQRLERSAEQLAGSQPTVWPKLSGPTLSHSALAALARSYT